MITLWICDLIVGLLSVQENTFQKPSLKQFDLSRTMLSSRLFLALAALSCGEWLVMGQETPTPLGLHVPMWYSLYGKDEFGNVTEEACPDGCVGGRDGSSCVMIPRSMFIESVCYPYITNSYSGYYKQTHNETTDIVCAIWYEDSDCTIPIRSDGLCDDEIELGVCLDSRPSYHTFHHYYPNHCIESSVPLGEYTVPMTSFIRYESPAECLADTKQEKGIMLTRINDRDFCVTDAGAGKDFFEKVNAEQTAERFQTGLRSYCDDQSNIVIDFYSDWQCSVQDTDTQFLINATFGSTCGLLGVRHVRTSCTVDYHCKDLDNTVVGLQIPLEAAGNPTTSAGYTRSFGGLSTTVLACWMVLSLF